MHTCPCSLCGRFKAVSFSHSPINIIMPRERVHSPLANNGLCNASKNAFCQCDELQNCQRILRRQKAVRQGLAGGEMRERQDSRNRRVNGG